MSLSAFPAPQAVRTPEIVSKYFVAPPNESDRTVGRTLTILGICLVAGGWILPFLFVALAAGSSTDGYGQSSSDGLGTALFGIVVFFTGNTIGWPMLYFGVRRLYLYSRQRGARYGAPSDADMERWFNEDLESLKAYGIQELNLPSDTFTREPLVVVGPSLPTDYAVGWDGVPRFASYEAAVVCLTDTSVGVFTCVINFLTGHMNLETTHEFAFADVTSIATFNARTAAHGGGSSDGRVVRMRGPISMNYLSPADVNIRQEFRISLASGDSVAINVGCHINGANLTNENFRVYVRNTVKALRSTLREVKSA